MRIVSIAKTGLHVLALLLLVQSPITSAGQLSKPNQDEPQTTTKRLSLTSIGAVNSLDAEPDPDDPGVGGGIDMITMFRNRYIPKLDVCTSQMESVFNDWAMSNDLTVPYSSELPGDLTIHATGAKIDGFFELTYRVTQSKERARVTVFFVSSTGEATSATAIEELIKKWDVTGLQDALDLAMACNV